MTSTATRVAGAVAALGALVLLAACGNSSDDASANNGVSDTPVITGAPAGFNADDVAFATNMIPHHQQAVELSRLAADHSTNAEVTALADQIAATQQPEINVLNVFLVQWRENPDIKTDPGGVPGHDGTAVSKEGMVDDATVAKLESLHGTDFDKLWLQSMIGHHENAVARAQAEIANGTNIDAIAMAHTIAAAQQTEIGQMKQMLEGLS